MLVGINRFDRDVAVAFAADFLELLPEIRDPRMMRSFMSDVTLDLGFDHFALITHEDLREPRPGQVDIRAYPDAVSERIIGQANYRRDPVMRGCVFADSAFLWSRLGDLITIDGRDRSSLEFGQQHGLAEGISVPCGKLGHCLGSVTFAGALSTGRAEKLIGLVQMIGVFAFKQARVIAGSPSLPTPRPRLNPRPRDCVVLVGRGFSNKEIARALRLAPRTVDGYLRDAFRIFGASDRTELVVAAILAGEVGLNELR